MAYEEGWWAGMTFCKMISEYQRPPRGFAPVYCEVARQQIRCYPLGIHWIMKAWFKLRDWVYISGFCKTRYSETLQKTISRATNEGYELARKEATKHREYFQPILEREAFERGYGAAAMNVQRVLESESIQLQDRMERQLWPINPIGERR